MNSTKPARAVLTAGSSNMTVERWWEEVTLPTEIVETTLGMVVRGVVAETPGSGVAVVIRVAP